MEDASPSFYHAANDLRDWLSDLLQTDVMLQAAGHPATGADAVVIPWRLDRDQGEVCGDRHPLSARGRFCLSIGPEAPYSGCVWYEKSYFAAMTSRDFALSLDDPPQAFWKTPPGLMLTITRRIRRFPDATQPSIVKVPLVVDIRTIPRSPNPVPQVSDPERT